MGSAAGGRKPRSSRNWHPDPPPPMREGLEVSLSPQGVHRSHEGPTGMGCVGGGSPITPWLSKLDGQTTARASLHVSAPSRPATRIACALSPRLETVQLPPPPALARAPHCSAKTPLKGVETTSHGPSCPGTVRAESRLWHSLPEGRLRIEECGHVRRYGCYKGWVQ